MISRLYTIGGPVGDSPNSFPSIYITTHYVAMQGKLMAGPLDWILFEAWGQAVLQDRRENIEKKEKM